MKQNLPKRKPTRMPNYDYNTTGAYFITICTENRCQILSRVGVDVLGDPQPVEAGARQLSFDASQIELLPYGKIAEQYINQLNDYYHHDIKVDCYVIMPNHIHMILVLSEGGASRTSPPTRQHSLVSRFVSTFKRFCNKEYGRNIWQRYFYDHIIRNQKDYDEHFNYIVKNPMYWKNDALYKEE